jgi:oligopeptidase B
VTVSTNNGKPSPPVAPRRPHQVTHYGQTWVDDYYWMRFRDDPQVFAYLNAENTYAEQMLAHTTALQAQLFTEMKGRLMETDHSVPEQIDGYLYYNRLEPGKQYAIHCRRRTDLGAVEEIVLDENTLAEGQSFFHLGAFQPSPDHRWLAYATDANGAESFILHIKNLETGEALTECIANTTYGIEWANDNCALFYTILDSAKRPDRLFRHSLGTDPALDVLVYNEIDDRFSLFISKTSSKAYLVLYIAGGDTTEIRYTPADQPEAEFTVLQPRQHGVEYSLAHHGDLFFIVTNENALNFKLMAAPVSNPARQNWRERIPNRPHILLDSIEVFRDYLVRFEREGGLRRIRVSNIDGSAERDISFPDPGYAVYPSNNPEFNTQELRFNYSSLVTPYSVIDYDMAAGEWKLRKQDVIPSGYNPGEYQSERITATAPDGVNIPISLVYRKGFTRNGSHPLLLIGYGSYGMSFDPGFDSIRLSLLDRGFAFAIAHIRGGAEMGRAWYEAGRLVNKQNTFSDFIACAEHLVAQGYTSSHMLAIMGRSAGGLLMGVVVNMRPDLFRAVVADVPFVDVITTMSDPTIPLTTLEYSQWGDPHDRANYDAMRAYSPYDNVKAQAYPDMLVTGGLNDPRVAFWEPAKWVARLRTLKTDNNQLLLMTNLRAGHAGPSGRYNHLRDMALKYAFLIDRLGSSRRQLPGGHEAARASGRR